MLFQAKLDTMLGSANKDHLIDKERSDLRAKIDGLNKEILQYENNLSFFSNADDSNPLFKNVMSSIGKTKSEIEGHKVRLKLIRSGHSMNKAINIFSGIILLMYTALVMGLIFDLSLSSASLKGMPYQLEICHYLCFYNALIGRFTD